MPVNAELIHKLPNQISGYYLSLGFNDNNLFGQLHRIDRISDDKLIVYEQQIQFIDSTSFFERQLTSIDAVWFENNYIYTQTLDSLLIFTINDTISSGKEKIEISINLSDNKIYAQFEDTLSCEIKFSNNYYYVNSMTKLNLWRTMRIKIDQGDILIKEPIFNLRDTNNPTKSLIEKYNLTPIKGEHSKFYIQHYKSDLNDDKFELLMNNEPVFKTLRLYKLKNVGITAI